MKCGWNVHANCVQSPMKQNDQKLVEISNVGKKSRFKVKKGRQRNVIFIPCSNLLRSCLYIFTHRIEPICSNRNKCDKYMNIVSLFFKWLQSTSKMLCAVSCTHQSADKTRIGDTHTHIHTASQSIHKMYRHTTIERKSKRYGKREIEFSVAIITIVNDGRDDECGKHTWERSTEKEITYNQINCLVEVERKCDDDLKTYVADKWC